MKDSSEKSKRRMDGLLDNLSDDELLALKRRLADVADEPLADYVGDDGELVRRR